MVSRCGRAQIRKGDQRLSWERQYEDMMLEFGPRSLGEEILINCKTWSRQKCVLNSRKLIQYFLIYSGKKEKDKNLQAIVGIIFEVFLDKHFY